MWTPLFVKQFKNAGKVVDNDDPIINLARLVDNDSLAKQWKFSKEDHTTLLTLVNNKDKTLIYKTLFLSKLLEKWNYNFDSQMSTSKN